MNAKKLNVWIVITAILMGPVIVVFATPMPGLSNLSKFGLVCAFVVSSALFSLGFKVENVVPKLALKWMARAGVWVSLSYLIKQNPQHLRDWEMGAMLATIFLPFDWWDFHKAKEKRLDELAAQNLPPMNFNLK